MYHLSTTFLSVIITVAGSVILGGGGGGGVVNGAASDEVVRISAVGAFDVELDFSTFSALPVGSNCELSVSGTLLFNSGTIDGVAEGTTTALVFAPCEDATSTPPGTFRDVFQSELTFAGTIMDGVPAISDLTYRGKTAVGGAIEAKFLFTNGVIGVLDVDAIVGVGGTYEGTITKVDEI